MNNYGLIYLVGYITCFTFMFCVLKNRQTLQVRLIGSLMVSLLSWGVVILLLVNLAKGRLSKSKNKKEIK